MLDTKCVQYRSSLFIGLFFSDGRARRSMRERKPVTRTQSAPYRKPDKKQVLKRQTSSEALPIPDQEPEADPNQPLISLPNTVSTNKLFISLYPSLAKLCLVE